MPSELLQNMYDIVQQSVMDVKFMSSLRNKTSTATTLLNVKEFSKKKKIVTL